MSYLRMRRFMSAALIGGGTLLQLGSCGPADIAGVLAGVNPCLTVLVCDPRQYAFATSGIEGPGPGAEKDPFCTFPPFCTQEQDPLYGALLGGP